MTADPIRGDVIVEMTNIRRRFGSTVALDGVDLAVRTGEIHAVLGANGAGKTTLMRILAGLDHPDDGTVSIGGSVVTSFDPGDARRAGVALVQQHFTLIPTLSASANLFLARPDGRLRPTGRRMSERLDGLVERFGLAVRDGVPVSTLSVGEQQRLELLRALDADADVLVLDEPTAVLTDAEADQLLIVCRQLADEGRAIAMITHRLGEVLNGCDRVSVLRGGRPVLTDAPVDGLTREDLATAMVGTTSTGTFSVRDRAAPADAVGVFGAHHLDHRPAAESPAEADVRLEVAALSVGRLYDVSIEVRAGEILGIAGVDGNGQSELEAALSGRVRPDSGTIRVDGQPSTPLDPRARRRAGVAYVPSDRYRHALVRPMEISDNLELGRTPRVRRRRSQRHSIALEQLDNWDVRSAGPGARASSLSGGNAQKVVLARELDGEPGVVLACYPTRGLDPNAAAAVADRLVARAIDGAAVLWIGAELDELFAVADRVVVLAAGRISGEFTPPFDRGAVGLAMTNSLTGSTPS
jgi:simple sugar transport system ATP-binding protein